MPPSPRTIHAKRLGNKALLLCRDEGRFDGCFESNGELKNLTVFEDGPLKIEHLSPHYSIPWDTPEKSTKRPTERRIEVYFCQRKVLRIEWDAIRSVVVSYEPGDWEHQLRY